MGDTNHKCTNKHLVWHSGLFFIYSSFETIYGFIKELRTGLCSSAVLIMGCLLGMCTVCVCADQTALIKLLRMLVWRDQHKDWYVFTWLSALMGDGHVNSCSTLKLCRENTDCFFYAFDRNLSCLSRVRLFDKKYCEYIFYNLKYMFSIVIIIKCCNFSAASTPVFSVTWS